VEASKNEAGLDEGGMEIPERKWMWQRVEKREAGFVDDQNVVNEGRRRMSSDTPALGRVGRESEGAVEVWRSGEPLRPI
jgi:hypothetical protein